MSFSMPALPALPPAVPSTANESNDFFDAAAELYVKEWAESFVETLSGKRLRIDVEDDVVDAARTANELEIPPNISPKLPEIAVDTSQNEAMDAIRRDLSSAFGELNAILNVINLIRPPAASASSSAKMQVAARQPSLSAMLSSPLNATGGNTAYLFDRTTVVGHPPPAEWYTRQTLRARGKRSLQLQDASNTLSTASSRLRQSLALNRETDSELSPLINGGWTILSPQAVAADFLRTTSSDPVTSAYSTDEVAAAVRQIVANVTISDSARQQDRAAMTSARPILLGAAGPDARAPSPTALRPAFRLDELLSEVSNAVPPYPHVVCIPPWLPEQLQQDLRHRHGMGIYAAVVPTQVIRQAIPPRIAGKAHTDAVMLRRITKRRGLVSQLRASDISAWSETSRMEMIAPTGYSRIRVFRADVVEGTRVVHSATLDAFDVLQGKLTSVHTVAAPGGPEALLHTFMRRVQDGLASCIGCPASIATRTGGTLHDLDVPALRVAASLIAQHTFQQAVVYMGQPAGKVVVDDTQSADLPAILVDAFAAIGAAEHGLEFDGQSITGWLQKARLHAVQLTLADDESAAP